MNYLNLTKKDFVPEKHLKKDLPILEHLLKKDFDVMFLNGITVVENVRICLKNIKLEEKPIPFTKPKVVIYHGKYNNIKVVGWNLYLQSAAGAGLYDLF